MFIIALLAPLIAPYGAEERNWAETKLPPNTNHLFGTDNTGGDVFSRVIWATRLDFSVAIIVVGISMIIGASLGVISGFSSGVLDELIMRITDVFMSFPPFILAMAIAATLGRSVENLMIALIIVWWPTYARLVRGQVLSEKEKLYVESAKAIGAKPLRIMFKHILPNSIYPLIVASTLELGTVIMSIAGLSLIGFGVPPGSAEWGRMIADGRAYMFNQPWISTFPGVAIFIASMGFSLLGDGLRDILDPRLRR
jgi:peptide/nickel transport system permease protein